MTDYIIDIPKNESPPGLDQAASGLSEHRIAASPRQRFLQEAATNTLEEHTSLAPKKWHSFKQPLPLILQTFQELTAKNEDFWGKAMPYFERHEIVHGTVLFSRGQDPDAFYLLEQGMLHAHYTLPVGNYQESIVAGTTCGELPFFSETARTATVSAEKDCITWRLSKASWEEMQKDWPEGAQEILRIAMKLTKERFDGIVAYVLTTAG